MKTAKQSYETSKANIDKDLTNIMKKWTIKKAQMEAHLKANESSWYGIGKGSELEDLERTLREILNRF